MCGVEQSDPVTRRKIGEVTMIPETDRIARPRAGQIIMRPTLAPVIGINQQ